MSLGKLCPPALIYVMFSVTQIIIDTFKGLYNTAFLKVWVTIIFTILLNFLCDSGLGIISWFIVFIPFILMTLIISILLLVFGLNPSTGKVHIIDSQNGPLPSTKPIDVRAESARQNINSAPQISTTPKQKPCLSKTATDVSSVYADAKKDASSGYADAKKDVSSGYADVKKDVSSGYADVKKDVSSGYADIKNLL
jgi:hypothetical protein